MKLYTYDPAPNPQRLAMFMQYKGIECDTQQVDLMQKEQLQETYSSLVPERTVPALVLDDGTVLSEVIGICSYLEALHPEKPLLGTTPLERARVIGWDHKLFVMVLMAVAEVLRNGNPGFAGRALPGPVDVEQIPELAERGKLRLGLAWQSLDQTLADRPWIAGDNFSFADIDMVVCASFSGWVQCAPPEELANLQAYLARAKAELGMA